MIRRQAATARWSLRARWTLVMLGLCIFGAVFDARPLTAADRIILRKLEVITDRTVRSFDEDGVVLDNARVLTWDEIEKATVATGQEAFDAMLTELGGPLYRLRQRLSVGDYAGATAPAEAVFPRYAARRSRTSYLVFQTLMWSRLAEGRREEAVEPYLLAVECWRALPQANEQLVLPGNRQLRWDAKTALSDELLPMWFDAEAARRVLPRVGVAIAAMKTPWPPGARIYYASLAAAAGETDRMQAALGELEPSWQTWREIVLAQAALTAGDLEAQLPALERIMPADRGMARALATYLAGRGASARGAAEQRRQGLLKLLRVPAVYGTDYPELSAAALYHTMQVLTELQDLPASIAVRNELLDKFPTTHFANVVRSQAEQR